MLVNNWMSCEKSPPPQYTRIEIKDRKGEKYIGYRYKDTYFETYGNYVIKYPMYWRYVPEGSTLLKDLYDKLYRSFENCKEGALARLKGRR